jgi:hypothetical protein
MCHRFFILPCWSLSVHLVSILLTCFQCSDTALLITFSVVVFSPESVWLFFVGGLIDVASGFIYDHPWQLSDFHCFWEAIKRLFSIIALIHVPHRTVEMS